MWKESYLRYIEKLKRNLNTSYNKHMTIENGYKPRMAILKESVGTLITDKSEIAEQFRGKFETIF